MVAAERYGEVVKMNEKARRTAQEREIFNTLCEDNSNNTTTSSNDTDYYYRSTVT